MELKKSSSPFFVVSAIASGMIFLFGVWWLYLIFKLSDRLATLNAQDGINIGSLIKWEGTTFLVLVLILLVSHTLLFIRDQRKNRSITAFFAGLTHELKTPLASIKLQSEVIKDEVDGIDNQRLEKLTNRLIEDTIRLENQMDKILQLSRLERNGNLNFVDVDISHFIASIVNNGYATKLNVNLETDNDSISVKADEFALSIIIKNLLENTISHTDSKEVDVRITQVDNHAVITYQDKGTFSGDIQKLGNLFYKHESTKGSGIGLYLSRKLIDRMNGSLTITKESGLIFNIELPLSDTGAEDE